MGACAEPSCNNPSGSRGPRAMYCKSHQQQMRRWGYVKPLYQWIPAAGETCAAEDCDVPADAKGFCKKHWKRYWKHGDPQAVKTVWYRKDPFSLVGYYASHDRIRRYMVDPADSPCIECGGVAEEWAYDGTDPTELISDAHGSLGCRYSLYPEFYMPMCIRCHRRRDLGAHYRKLREGAVAK